MLEAKLDIVRDPSIDAYFANMIAKLAGYMKSPFTYSVVVFVGGIPESSRAAALVMPVDYMQADVREPVSVAGGTVFVPLYLLADAPCEEWLAFQVAHAMAHIASRHATRLESRLDVVRLDLVKMPMDPSMARHVALISFSRRFERDADAASVYTMSDAGYNPNRVLPLDGLDTSVAENMFPSLRVKAEHRNDILEKTITRLPKRDYVHWDANFINVKKIAEIRLRASHVH